MRALLSLRQYFLHFRLAFLILCIIALTAIAVHISRSNESEQDDKQEEPVIEATGLVPAYPQDRTCSEIKSLYASLTDIDGLPREEKHSGIDGGRLGEPILAPASGIVLAGWIADWQWGPEGALLIRHTRKDLNLSSGAPYYYSAFYHLQPEQIGKYNPGDLIQRGQIIANVFRPGGKKKYIPEVHLETWEVTDDSKLDWKVNAYSHPYWINKTAKLVDPLYLMGLNENIKDRTVTVTPFDTLGDNNRFRGFTYIFSCRVSE